MIICLFGNIGTGKDTVAEYLEKRYGFHRVQFAKKLKDVVSVLFDWDREMLEGKTEDSRVWRETVDPWWSDKLGVPNLTPRLALQLIGTNALRDNFSQNIWTTMVERTFIDHPNVVISDGRFINEAECVKRNDGYIWRISRGNDPEWWQLARVSPDSMEKQYPNVHKSEWALASLEYDDIILNVGSIDALYEKVEKSLDNIF